MKEGKVRRFAFLPPELDAWLVEESEKDMRSPSALIAKILDAAKNEKARSASTPQALDVNTQTSI